MNIEQAKRIAMSEILEKINCKPQKTIHKENWYFSPLRKEDKESFKVNLKTNKWYDFGLPGGGDPVDFACAYLQHTGEEHTLHDGLRWIKNMVLAGLTPIPFLKEYKENGNQLAIRKVEPIAHKGLEQYLKQRGITLKVAQQYLKEIRVYNPQSGKYFSALGFKSEEKGYELRNPSFKGCIGKKQITFIRGTKTEKRNVHIFEGFMDFLSLVERNNGKKLQDDVIVLNSLSCLEKIIPYLKDYKYRIAYTWLDNDAAGKKATLFLNAFFQNDTDIIHTPLNGVYKTEKDFSDWHISQQKIRVMP
jgi:DNA primase